MHDILFTTKATWCTTFLVRYFYNKILFIFSCTINLDSILQSNKAVSNSKENLKWWGQAICTWYVGKKFSSLYVKRDSTKHSYRFIFGAVVCNKVLFRINGKKKMRTLISIFKEYVTISSFQTFSFPYLNIKIYNLCI